MPPELRQPVKSQSTDPNSTISTWTYDSIGRPKTIKAALGSSDESDTTFNYFETPGATLPIEVQELRDLSSAGDGALITTKFFDQRGSSTRLRPGL